VIPKIIAATVTGLVCVSCCALFAFAMGGAGHGWLTPLFVSLSGFVLFPLTFSCAATRASRTLCMAVLVLLALADVALYLKTQNEGVEYFYRAGGFGLFWIAMWLAGHVPAAWPLVFPRHAEEFEDAFD
jgi:FtsH-binding integral membrane protein